MACPSAAASRGALNAEDRRAHAAGRWAALLMALAMLLLNRAAGLAAGLRCWRQHHRCRDGRGQEWRLRRGPALFARGVSGDGVGRRADMFVRFPEAAFTAGVALSIAVAAAQRQPAWRASAASATPSTTATSTATRCAARPACWRCASTRAWCSPTRASSSPWSTATSPGLPDTRRVVLLMSPVNAIDYSALEAPAALHDLLADAGHPGPTSPRKGPVLDRLRAGGWAQWFGGRVPQPPPPGHAGRRQVAPPAQEHSEITVAPRRHPAPRSGA